MILLNFCFKLHGHNFWHHFCPCLHHCHPSILAGTTTILLPNKLSQGFGFQFLPLYLDEYTKSSSSDFKGGWKGEMFNQTCRAQRTTQERKTSPIISIFCQLCLSRPTNSTYCNYLGWFARFLLFIFGYGQHWHVLNFSWVQFWPLETHYLGSSQQIFTNIWN